MSVMDFVRRLVGSKPKRRSQATPPQTQNPASQARRDEPTVFRPVPQFEPEPEPEPPPAADTGLGESSSRGRPDQPTMMGELPGSDTAEAASAPAPEAGQPGGEAATVYVEIPREPEPVRRQIGTLTTVEGELQGQVFGLLEGENQIGRSPDSDVVLSSRFVSRVHAKLLCSDGRVSFVPVSDQLTLINGKAASETDIKDGDKIQLGRTTLQLRIES